MTTPTQPEIYKRLIPEAGPVILDRRLGRHVEHDPRSKNFPAEGAPQIVDVLHAAFGLPLNQGSLGSCTANALAGAANTQPNFTGALALARTKLWVYPHDELDAVDLYEKETADEGQPYPPNDPGGSGLAVCKAARELAWIERYAHAFSLDAALRALVLRPVITGINWYTSFDSPDSNGLVAIAPGATVRGGHEVVVVGIDTESQMIALWNSWGLVWGSGGKFYMSYATWEQLLAEDGDVTVPGAAVAR